MFAQSLRPEQNRALALQRSIENTTLRAQIAEEEKPLALTSRLRQPTKIPGNKSYRTCASDSNPIDCVEKSKESPVSSGSKPSKKTGIPVLTSLRNPLNNKNVKLDITTEESVSVDVPLKPDENCVSMNSEFEARWKPDSNAFQQPEPVDSGTNLSAKACKELINEVEQILSRTLLRGVVFGSIMEASKKKTFPLSDELSDILLHEGIADVKPEFSLNEEPDDHAVEGTSETALGIDMILSKSSMTLVNRRSSNRSDSLESCSRQSSRSRSYQKSRSRRSRKQYLIPVNASFKCSTAAAIVEQPKAQSKLFISKTAAAPAPVLDLKTLGSLFSFGTEELDKLSSVFIQASDRFCGSFINFFQDLMPCLSGQREYDVFTDEISYPKFIIAKTRNPLSCFFANCENLKFAITHNQIPETRLNRCPSMVVECKECPAFDCSFHNAKIYICNGTMELGTCEHLSCNKTNPVMVLKNVLMHETMVVRTKTQLTRGTDSQFWIFRLDEASNDPFDDSRDGSVVAHIARSLPKVISPETFNRPAEVWPEQERITLTFLLSLDSFTKAIILGAALVLKHDILS